MSTCWNWIFKASRRAKQAGESPPASRALSLYPMGSRPEWSGHHLGYPFLLFLSFYFWFFFFLPSISFFFLPVPVPSCRQHSAGCRAIMLWRGFCTDSHRSYNIHFIQNCWMSSLSFISLFLFVYCLSSDYFGVGSDFERRQSLGGFIRSANIHHVDVVSFALFSLLFLLLSFFFMATT